MAKTVTPEKAARLWRDSHYLNQLWWAIAAFIALVAICQFVSWVVSRLRARRAPPMTEKGAAQAEAGGSRAVTRRFSWRNIPSAIVNAYRVVAFRWTLNIGDEYTLNMAEVVITCLYIVALFTWEFYNTTNPTTGKKYDARMAGNRAGILAGSQFALITALGTKNNVISYITGISYDKLNYMHRMMARVNFVMIWVHSAYRMTIMKLVKLEENYVRIGIMCNVAFTILLVLSIRPVRKRHYEIFYFTHFGTVFILVLGSYFHCERFDYGYLIWPSFLIWGLDRALRLARIFYYNHLYFSFHKTAHKLDASVELLSSNVARLHIQRPPHFKWTPGQTAYLIMPSISAFPLETHPFTIASVDSRYQLDAPKSASSSFSESTKTPASNADSAVYWKELVFLVNVREGFTKRLAQNAAKGEKVKVLVDGPYGFTPNLDADDTVVLVAGGSGVTFTLSTFLGVLSHVQHEKSRCRKVIFFWCIRDATHVEWISDALSKALERAPAGLNVSIRIFVTGKHDQGSEYGSINSSEGEGASHKERAPSLLSHPAVCVAHGRPDLPALLREEVDANSGRMSVTVCGSTSIARACRTALRIPMSTTLSGAPSVTLHVESFGYA